MNFKLFSSVFCLILGFLTFAQNANGIKVKPLSEYPQDKIQTDKFGNRFYYDAQQKAKIYNINDEPVIVMDEIVLVAKPHFNNRLDRNFYSFLSKKLNRVYPLFLQALYQYREISEETANMSDKKERRKFIKAKQQELANQYEAKLRDLTTTEGRVFAKLMYRATGKTVYQIIKELKGGWSAFWWNVKGNLANVEINEPYAPHKNREDAFIESLLQSNWNMGYLRPYDGYQNFQIKK
ncbi:DUF4294 domain-containing protein [Riemerella columbipharyngis]|nr:DUF4294 domain-containing protein [Riemerella columbipharyngis]